MREKEIDRNGKKSNEGFEKGQRERDKSQGRGGTD